MSALTFSVCWLHSFADKLSVFGGSKLTGKTRSVRCGGMVTKNFTIVLDLVTPK